MLHQYFSMHGLLICSFDVVECLWILFLMLSVDAILKVLGDTGTKVGFSCMLWIYPPMVFSFFIVFSFAGERTFDMFR